MSGKYAAFAAFKTVRQRMAWLPTGTLVGTEVKVHGQGSSE